MLSPGQAPGRGPPSGSSREELEHLLHSLEALLHQTHLHEQEGLPDERECQAGTGATVAQVPEPRPRSVRQEPEPRCPA